jgi:Protein of unknown function (DUF1769)
MPKSDIDGSTTTTATISGSTCSEGAFDKGDHADDDEAALYDALQVAVDDMPPNHAGQHPSLASMCVVDTSTKQRIVPNSPMPFPLNNECFTGHVMLLVRTPDVDESHSVEKANMGDTPKRVSEYFSDKKRRFEFQFQIRLKKVPTGPLFLGCELEHPIKVGAITKGLVGVLLAMVRRINPGFHYSWGTQPVLNTDGKGVACKATKQEKEILASGKYEKTHLSFPVEASMDIIVITKAGDEPPALGSELYEAPESIKRRRKLGAGSVPWNTTDTFTMCLWSAYCDWIQWRSLNVPGVSPFSLCRVTATQPIYLCVYELPGMTTEEYRKKRPPHKRCDLTVYARLEFSNANKTIGGYGPEIISKDVTHEHSERSTSRRPTSDRSLAAVDDGRLEGHVGDDSTLLESSSRRHFGVAASTVGRGVVGSDAETLNRSDSFSSLEAFSRVTMSS